VVLGLGILAAACLPVGAPVGTARDSPDGRPIRVAAAADLRFAMDELITDWNGREPSTPAEAVYGSSGNFFAQISQGAPFDVFFSADAAYPRELEAAGLAEPGVTRLYAIGQIVVWVLADSRIDPSRGLEGLTDPSVRSVAIANPEHAPYGRAAEAAMRSAAVYEAIEPKLVLGENVSQAAQFVESGSADAGVIALSLAVSPALQERGRFAVVPIDSYPPIEQGAVVLGAAADPEAARAFLDFVLGPDGRHVLDRFGFLPPAP
jgi:molybdate transport system substrate-binding protein